MASPLSRSEIEKLLETCRIRQNTYPETHVQHQRIQEQIDGLEEKLSALKE